MEKSSYSDYYVYGYISVFGAGTVRLSYHDQDRDQGWEDGVADARFDIEIYGRPTWREFCEMPWYQEWQSARNGMV